MYYENKGSLVQLQRWEEAKEVGDKFRMNSRKVSSAKRGSRNSGYATTKKGEKE